MPQEPISSAFAAILRSDAVAALAAAFIIATHHSDVLAWVAKTISPAPAEPAPMSRKPNGAVRHSARLSARNRGVEHPGLGSRKSAANGGDRSDRRLAKRDKADERLLEAMRSEPDASIGAWAATIGKGRSSTVSALHRLRDAGKAESKEGRWRLVESEAPREPPPKWTKPLSGAERAHQVHLTA